MKRGRRITRLDIFRAVQLCITLAVIVYIAWAAAEVRAGLSRGLVYVKPLINSAEFAFGPEEMDILAVEYKGEAVAEHVSRTAVSAGGIEKHADVIITGYQYFEWQPMEFTDGGPWIPAREDDFVAVLNESLAWALFGGTVNLTGQTVVINDEAYAVAGVVAQNTVTKDNGCVWIPLAEGEAQEAEILYLKPANYNRVDAYLQAEKLLKAMNRRAEDYTITDMTAYAESITLRGQLLMFITGLYVIFLMGLYTYRIGKRQGIRTWYITGICILAVTAVTAWMTRFMNLDLWVPAFMGEGMVKYVRALFNYGLPAPRVYLSDLNIKASAAFAVGLAGLIQLAYFTEINKD